jgi:hypothetical protein
MPVLGFSAVLANLDAASAEIEKQVGDSVQNAGIVTEGSAKKRCPVRTRRLRSAISYVRISAAACQVGNAVEYAPPVELGHRTASGTTVAPQPFMFPGYLDGKDALKADLIDLGLKIISWS